MTKRTIDQWATDVLLSAHVIAPCPWCGFMRLKFSHDSMDYAHGLAKHAPYPGKSKSESVKAIEQVYDRLSDECPGC